MTQKKKRIAALSVPVVLMICLLLPLTVGVWLPDTFSFKPHTLALTTTPNGHTFRIIQYWNGEDFYNTELWHTYPNGKLDRKVVDSDDVKQWNASLSVDAAHQQVGMTIGENHFQPQPW